MSINLKKAADATLKYIAMMESDAEPICPRALLPNELGLDYQKDILSSILNGNIWGDEGYMVFGWIHAALVINGIGDRVVYKMINYCCEE